MISKLRTSVKRPHGVGVITRPTGAGGIVTGFYTSALDCRKVAISRKILRYHLEDM